MLSEREARLESLMREHSARVFAYACNRGARCTEAEDVVAEVFLVCWRRLDDVPTLALPWILGVARKVLANQRRSRNRQTALRTRIEQDVASSDRVWRDTFAATTDANAGVLEALGQLAELDREALLLVAWDGLCYKDAAQVLGCTPTTFGIRLYRARRRLLKYLGGIRTSKELEASWTRGKCCE